MQTGPLDELTTLPVLVAIAAGPDGLHEHTIWERASRQGERERVLGFPGEPNPPGSDAPTVGPWAAGDGGRFAFGTSGPDGPALGLRQPGREVRLVPAPAPIRALTWHGDSVVILVDLAPGTGPRTEPCPPPPGAARVRAWRTLPVRDWNAWRIEAEPTLLRLRPDGWDTLWRGDHGDRVIGIAGDPVGRRLVVQHRRRGIDGADHDTLRCNVQGTWRTIPVPDRTTIDGLIASHWGAAWTAHTRPETGFGGPVAVRMPWDGSPETTAGSDAPWHTLHGFIGVDGALLISMARNGERILKRAGHGIDTELATGVTQAAGHAHGWVGVRSGIGQVPHRIEGSHPVHGPERRHPVARIRSTTGDGTWTDSWLVHAGEDQPRPTLLWIHGGPLSQWADVWHPRWCPGVFVDAGYTVLMPNPRGSLGRGAEFRDAVAHNRWGEGPIMDLLAALEQATDHPAVDANRLAVMGASYGGWAAAWLASTQSFFRCAVAHAAPSDFPALHGSTDVPGFLEGHFGGSPRSTDVRDRWSTIPRAPGWTTPTLITHGEQDMRVPVSQAISLFQALHRAGVPVELRTYPDAHHWLTRPGDVADWHEAVLSFLRQHMAEAQD